LVVTFFHHTGSKGCNTKTHPERRLCNQLGHAKVKDSRRLSWPRLMLRYALRAIKSRHWSWCDYMEELKISVKPCDLYFRNICVS